MRVTAHEQERRSGEEETVVARAPEPVADPRAVSALTTAHVLGLQARAGNQAVAKLLRLSAGGQGALKKKKGAPALATVEAWQKRGNLSNDDADAVVRGLNGEQLTEAVGLEPKHFKGAEDESDMTQRLAFARDATAMAAQSKSGQPKKLRGREVLADELFQKGIADSDARAFLNKEDDDAAVRAWLTGRGDMFVRQAVSVCVNKNARLSDLTTLFTLNAGLHGYADDKVIGWANTYGVGRVTDALNGTAADNSVNYVETWLSTGASAGSVVIFKKLVRLQARMLDHNGAPTVSQADVNYVSTKDPPSRTGFLEYDFGDGTVELHTHWNNVACKIVSIHVKEGADASTEVNQWSFFAEVNRAAVAAHNAETGARRPTTEPEGKALTL